MTAHDAHHDDGFQKLTFEHDGSTSDVSLQTIRGEPRWIVKVNNGVSKGKAWTFPVIRGWDVEASVKAWVVDWWNQYNTN